MCLAPRQSLGTPRRAPCEAPLTRTRCQVVPRDHAGVDGPADRRVGHTRRHRFRGPADDPCAHLHPMPARAAFDDLGVAQTGGWPPPRWGRGAPAPLAWRWRPCTGGVPPGGPVGRPRSAGAPRHRVLRARGTTGQQHSRTGLRTVAEHDGQDHAPDWGTGAPHPGVPRGGAIALGAGQRRLVGRHDTPPRVEVACPHRPSVPAGQQDRATGARHPRPPGTNWILVHWDAARGRAPRLACRQRTHRGRKHGRIGLQAVRRRAVTQDHTRFAHVPPGPRLPTAGTVLDHRPW